MSDSPEPIDKTLYAKVKAEAKRKFERFPSLYASSWITREYKKRGGKYKGAKPKVSNQSKWFKEKWVQVEPYLDGKRVECGSTTQDGKACRPLKKLEGTTLTMQEIIKLHGKDKVRELARKKQKDMKGRLNWKAGTFTPSK